MDDEIAQLRRALLEERRRREEAEELAEAAQPQTLQPYLEHCHSLNVSIQAMTDPSLVTQGDTTNPTGRLFPRRIIRWDGFPTEQEEIWNRVARSPAFCSQPVFPSQHQLEYVKSLLKPIGSEIGLRDFERDVVENAVQKLVGKVHHDPVLRSSLGVQGTVMFESHTNLGNPISEPVGYGPKAREAQGKGNGADQLCIYQGSDGRRFPAIAIKYRAPHKLSVAEIVTGLESEIQPERDMINKTGDGFAFAARYLTSVVITQLFSYMIGKGIQYGYVCTGQAFVFLHIPADPTTVRYYVSIPNQDVVEDDELSLHYTAVAQVFTFILQALRAGPASKSWHDVAASLDTWAVEHDDVLKNIPETARKKARVSPYKPPRWKGFQRSPIRTRSHCQQLDANTTHMDDNDTDDRNDKGPPSPSPNARKAACSKPNSFDRGQQEQRQDTQPQQQQQQRAAKPNIQDRPFCTQQCLLGLAYSQVIDPNCPNRDYHGPKHLGRHDFLRLVRAQLAVDRGHNPDSTPLHLTGSRGSLFKVRLSSHGYTLVAKGMESVNHALLRHENDMYDRLQDIQGEHIPVCLGSVDLVLPYYYNGGVYTRFLFLGWGGHPLVAGRCQANKADVVAAVTASFKAVHALRVLHRDAEPRNILYDANSGKLMVVDFERATFHGRPPLGSRNSNGRDRKRKRGMSHKQKDDFARELESVVEAVAKCVVGVV
ncbi:hypothetical protein BT67DRAFT_437713 [Trichocladium antarcticum]|uniref:Protein kinase domain-containing protein n=1 Tax=Trichocladium antarcticum TaxID=1450529 RepID=A0AAN6USG2_9PEZI|nr:hypothetical protein BT67DRAFT_437713 [Trichocladium antarcticum]